MKSLYLICAFIFSALICACSRNSKGGQAGIEVIELMTNEYSECVLFDGKGTRQLNKEQLTTVKAILADLLVDIKPTPMQEGAIRISEPSRWITLIKPSGDRVIIKIWEDSGGVVLVSTNYYRIGRAKLDSVISYLESID